ncbi:glycosyltransferase family 4 protein [Ochrovirga pacifica]|uniref:glycosyltransferase family 4 protein n=1 Tax=Ochrovirga pacifica TaxID=1042376 RepID=UPI0002559DFF|nr:glycosyltransferase family 4 protein [Ochrovirga pacifica]
MKIALLAPSDKSFIKDFLPKDDLNFLPDGYSGAPFIGTLLKEFLDMGHEVVAITTTKAIDGDYEVKSFINDKFSWHVVPYRPNSLKKNGNKLGRIVDLFAFEKEKMKSIIQDVKPDIVHAHWSYEFAGAAIKSGYPYLVTIHDNPFVILKYFKNLYRFGRLLMAEMNLKKVDKATTVSPYMLGYANKRCKQVKVVPNPIQIEYYIDEVKKMIDDRISTIGSPRIFMINNGWDERKNGKSALLAFKNLLDQFPNASLHLFGSGSEKEGVAFKEAQEIGLEENIFFNGAVTRDYLLEQLKMAHLFLHPALEESFGVVLIESMSMGIPAIGGDKSGAVPWVINQKELLVNVRDYSDILNKLTELIKDETKYKKLALSCYENVVNRFSSESVSKQYLDSYEEVLKAKL